MWGSTEQWVVGKPVRHQGAVLASLKLQGSRRRAHQSAPANQPASQPASQPARQPAQPRARVDGLGHATARCNQAWSWGVSATAGTRNGSRGTKLAAVGRPCSCGRRTSVNLDGAEDVLDVEEGGGQLHPDREQDQLRPVRAASTRSQHGQRAVGTRPAHVQRTSSTRSAHGQHAVSFVPSASRANSGLCGVRND